ncbi:MAG: hypothetical protein U0350_34055 [Caldilineaceae bacterium]
MNTLLTGPLTLGDLFDRAIRFYRAYFRELVIVPLLFIVPFLLLNGFLQLTVRPTPIFRWSALANNPFSIFRLLNAVGANSRCVLIVTNLQLAIIAFVSLVLTVQIAHLWQGKTLGVKTSLGEAKRYIWRYLKFLFLLGLIGVGIGIVLFLLILLLFMTTNFSSRLIAPLTAMLIVVTFLLLMVRWAFVGSVLIVEGIGTTTAMRRSRQLTQGLYWRTLAFFVISFLLGYILGNIPIILFNAAAALLAPDRLANVIGSIRIMLQGFMVIVVLPLSTTLHVLYYYDLRMRKEGYDLLLQVQQMENQVLP